MLRTLAAAIAIAAALPAEARIPSNCIALADAGPEQVMPAAFGDPLAEDTVRIRYIDHAEFAIEVPGGLVAVTDFTGYIGMSDRVPDVVTMNNAHSSHWTDSVDPRISHVLRGWPQDGLPAWHDLDLGGLRVRNVTTDTRGPFGEGARADGNSIFIFEAAGLCIGHLGHLHQIPSPAQYAAIGRLDVVMVPVDGGYTMTLPAMMGVVDRLRARVVIPMHWFSGAALEAFVAGMAGTFDVVRSEDSEAEFSLDTLPDRPMILVLQPAWLP